MSTLKIKVIVGSTRANRFSEKPAQWIFNMAGHRADLDVELLDLREYPLPFFEEALPPAAAKDNYTPQVVKWREKITENGGLFSVCPLSPVISVRTSLRELCHLPTLRGTEIETRSLERARAARRGRSNRQGEVPRSDHLERFPYLLTAEGVGAMLTLEPGK